MADLVKAESGVREQEPEAYSLDPLIWSEISRHLTTEEWACAAGTCKTSWDLQLPHLRWSPNQNTPTAGVLGTLFKPSRSAPWICHLMMIPNGAGLYGLRHSCQTKVQITVAMLVAGYMFMRRRCLAALSISLTAARGDADYALKKLFGCDVVLKSIKHLSATDGQNNTAVPYISIYDNSSCPHLQVITNVTVQLCHIFAPNIQRRSPAMPF